MNRVLLIALVLLRFCCTAIAEDEAKPVCLLTGFGPFGSQKENPSSILAEALDGQIIDGYKMVGITLPVVYDAISKPLETAVKKYQPKILLSFGVGSKDICIEKLARNGYHPMQFADNEGKLPPRKEIIPGKSATIPTALPVEAMQAALKQNHIGVRTSNDAGGYLCNECFYRVMALPKAPATRGFIHIPQFGQEDPAGGTFTKAKLLQAMKLLIGVAVEHQNQLKTK